VKETSIRETEEGGRRSGCVGTVIRLRRIIQFSRKMVSKKDGTRNEHRLHCSGITGYCYMNMKTLLIPVGPGNIFSSRGQEIF